jgi:hypothetical protein
MRYSVKFRKQNNHNKSMKMFGGTDARSIKAATKKMDELKKNTADFCTSGELSSSMPRAILEAKKAIQYANDNPGNEYVDKIAEIKSEIADYWAKRCSKRKNWRNEKNMDPNRSARDWYEPGPKLIWKVDINGKAKQNMNKILPGLMEHISMIPEENENSEIGKEFRRAQRRFERRTRGSSSRSRSRSSSSSRSRSPK